jgi:NTE family protein
MVNAMSPAKPERTAFVIAGGGSFGAVHVGMLRALLAHGVTPDFVVGSSVGAMNGAYFAFNPDPAGVERLAEIWHLLTRREIFPVGLETLANLALHGEFGIETGGLRRLIERHLPGETLERAQLPIHIVATDFLSGEAFVMSDGPVAEAVIASCAIPAAFAPVNYRDHYLTDGAVASNTPIMVAADLGATRAIVLPTGFACALKTPPRGAIAHALHAITLLIARQLISDMRIVGSRLKVVIVPPLCPLGGSAYDFSRATSLIDQAARSTEDWLAGGGLDRSEVPGALEAHGHVTAHA